MHGVTLNFNPPPLPNQMQLIILNQLDMPSFHHRVHGDKSSRVMWGALHLLMIELAPNW